MTVRVENSYTMMGWQLQSCGWKNRMIQRRNLPLCIACCFLFLIHGLSGQTLQIIDAEGRSSTLTAAQITGSPHVTVSVQDHDVPAHFEGVSLAAVLSSAGIQLGDKLVTYAILWAHVNRALSGRLLT